MPHKSRIQWTERKRDGKTEGEMWQRVTCHKLKWHVPLTYRQKIKHGKTVHVCWEQSMDTFFQEMLGGVGRLQENVGVTLFLKERDKKKTGNT